MRRSIPFLASALVAVFCLAATTARSQVVINELAYDDSGDDDEEFLELYNPSEDELDLSGWYLTTGSDLGAGPRYDLGEDVIIDAGDFLVIGSVAVPNVDIEFVGTGFLGNGPGYMILWTADEAAVDAVSWETNKGTVNFPDEALAEGGIWGNHVLVSESRLSWQRWFDGVDSDVNGADFGHLPWTPGASNDRTEAPDFARDFEDGTQEQDIAALPGSFVPGRVIRPEATTTSNPNAIVESPDGGLAMIAWDPSGGGNFVVLDATPTRDMMFEAWVYFDATPEIGDEVETWSIGLRGTSGTFYNTPVLFDANGNTGVTWTYQVSAAGATLYLIDEGLGGPAAERVLIDAIEIIPGGNDGWQRLRLTVEGDTAIGYFGGTYGSTDDGVEVEGRLRETTSVGNFYIGYREALSDNSRARPPTIDRLMVQAPVVDGPVSFQRGDTNADGGTNLADAVYLLLFLAIGGSPPSCMEAADIDGNGALNVTDAIVVLNYLFRGGPPPMAPFPECGTAPDAEGLGCESFRSCP